MIIHYTFRQPKSEKILEDRALLLFKHMQFKYCPNHGFNRAEWHVTFDMMGENQPYDAKNLLVTADIDRMRISGRQKPTVVAKKPDLIYGIKLEPVEPTQVYSWDTKEPAKAYRGRLGIDLQVLIGNTHFLIYEQPIPVDCVDRCVRKEYPTR